MHYNAAAFLIAEALKPDFLSGKIRLPGRSFVPLVIPNENDPAALSEVGSDPDSIQDLASHQKSTKKPGV